MKKHILLSAYLLILTQLANAQLYFPPTDTDEWETTSPTSLGWCSNEIDGLYTYLDGANTDAFIVLKDGKIVLEKYFGTFTKDSAHVWNSAGKCIIANLVGIAQKEGDLNINDKTSDYLGLGWTSMPKEKEDLITIKHQLTMTTSMDDEGNRWACTDDTCLHYLSDAGSRWAYHNAAYNLLRDVLENATGKNLNIYTNQKLFKTTGMGGLWIKLSYFDIFLSKARSAARFGLLNLNKGVWDGVAVLDDEAYHNAMVSKSQELNKSYGYLWWLNGQPSYMIPMSQVVFNGMLNPNAPPTLYSAMGKDGQYIDIWPEENIVVVRMGGAPNGNDAVPIDFHRGMWGKLMNVICNVGSVKNTDKVEFNLYPNPARDILIIESDNQLNSVEITNTSGKVVLNTTQKQIDIGTLPTGVYFVKMKTQDGLSAIKKLVVY